MLDVVSQNVANLGRRGAHGYIGLDEYRVYLEQGFIFA